MTIRTRFAPSPTGYLHIGGARTALFSWLYARRHAGVFVLRIEDTDLERSTPESVDAILQGMTWLNLDYDEGPFYQTHRFDRYKEVIDQLLAQGKAYKCFCTREELDAMRAEQEAKKEKPRYNGLWRERTDHPEGQPFVIRFKNPTEGFVEWEDAAKGTIRIANSELDDLVLLRTDGSPTYNLTVVVDDVDMGITHVLRGDDHVNNTPRQINIYQAMGAKMPIFGHLPMVLGEDGARLSKRHGAVGVMQFRDEGYLPEAVINYIARLGWGHGDQEIFSVDELIQLFDIDRLSASPSTFDTAKLKWLNHHYIKTSSPEHIARHLSWHLAQRSIEPTSGPAITDVIGLLAERSETLVDMADSCGYFYAAPSHYEAASAEKHLTVAALPVLQALVTGVEALSEMSADAVQSVMKQVGVDLGVKMGQIGMPLRVALTGVGQSPAINEVAALLGQKACVARLQAAIQFVENKA
jgi:glutamyl-tRNA synthetase